MAPGGHERIPLIRFMIAVIRPVAVYRIKSITFIAKSPCRRIQETLLTKLLPKLDERS